MPGWVDYLYDGLGRRVAGIYPNVTITDQNTGQALSVVTDSYIIIYDGVAPVQKRSYVNNSAILDQYYYGLGLNNLVLARHNGTNYLPIQDDRGTIVGVADFPVQAVLAQNALLQFNTNFLAYSLRLKA